MQIFVKIGGHYFEISQFEKFVVTLGGRRTKLLLLTTWENFLKINGKMLEETLGS